MNHRLMLGAVAIGVVLAGNAAYGDDAADTQAVLAANAEWGQNFVACDLKRMDALLGDEHVVIQMTGQISNKTEFLNIVKGCGMESASSERVTARVFGNTAYVVGTLHFKMKNQPSGGSQTYNRIFVKQGMRWRMVADSHTPVAPPRR
jgi:ketosteroid isomerase-like protein